jgi:5'-nucleotidase
MLVGSRILVDMDMVIADYDGAFETAWKEKYPHQPCPLSAARSVYKPPLSADDRQKADTVRLAPGFMLSLRPVRGAFDALEAMEAAGAQIIICTALLIKSDHCANEKLAWVREHLGDHWRRRVIITDDKTLIRGDILIDDRPDVNGALAPEWEHVLFDRPYNRHIIGKRRLDWNTWRSVLGANNADK